MDALVTKGPAHPTAPRRDELEPEPELAKDLDPLALGGGREGLFGAVSEEPETLRL
jgi:hypothetical protein